MKTFAIEVIHEGTGTYMDFEIETDEPDLDEENIWRYVMNDLSIIGSLVNDSELDN